MVERARFGLRCWLCYSCSFLVESQFLILISELIIYIAYGKKKKCQKAKEKRKDITHLNAEFQRIARRDKKSFLSEQCK